MERVVKETPKANALLVQCTINWRIFHNI